MSTFALLTMVGGLAVIFSFFNGARAKTGPDVRVSEKLDKQRLQLFDLAVGFTILSALLA